MDKKNLKVKFFSELFSKTAMTLDFGKSGVVDIYDIATQFFVFGEKNTAIYGEFRFGSLVHKIVKDVRGGKYLRIEDVTMEDVTQFRRTFYKHPEFLAELDGVLEIEDETGVKENPIIALNDFFRYMAELQIYDDSVLVSMKEFRLYFMDDFAGYSKKEGKTDLRDEIYMFLNFDRFTTVDKKDIDAVLDKIVDRIEKGEMDDIRKYKDYNDRGAFPLDILSDIERLVLMNYNLKKTPRDAIRKMDLDFLKEMSEFVPEGRQRYYLVYESREGLMANSRRSGKSFLMTYLALRQVMIPHQMILYILPSKEDYSEQPFFYINIFVENIRKNGVEIPGFRFNEKSFSVSNKTLKSKIKFISAIGGSKGKSFSANLVIIDEAAYIDSGTVYSQSYNSTSDVKGRMVAVSTINIDTPINWFFYKKIELEGLFDSKVISVDIYQNPFLTDEEKKRNENKYKFKDPAVWNSDWMAIFGSASTGFDISRFFNVNFNYDVVNFGGIKMNLIRDLKKYNRLVLSYDPAKNMDQAGISLIGVVSPQETEVIMTAYLKIQNYFLQRETIIKMIKYFKDVERKQIDLVIDLGKAGEAAFDYFRSQGIFPYGVLSVGGQNIIRDGSRFNIPASIQEKNLKGLVSGGMITGYSRLEHIRNEFETYELSKERKAKGHHHDVLSSLMIGVAVLYERGLINFKSKINYHNNVEGNYGNNMPDEYFNGPTKKSTIDSYLERVSEYGM